MRDVGNNGNLSQILLKLTGERARLDYDLIAISRVLPTVPRMRLSCILCTWFPLRRSEDSPVEPPGRESGSTGQADFTDCTDGSICSGIRVSESPLAP